ncbi:hypothetical protein, partial [Streptosporangium roseum]|uniref:hypothetical protein n=1 Tax=Streptosporangium roseum TaxID=2001 RepID=UPI001E3FAEA2
PARRPPPAARRPPYGLAVAVFPVTMTVGARGADAGARWGRDREPGNPSSDAPEPMAPGA